MSFYNMLLGENPHRATLMNILGLRRRDCGRFRDVYCSDDGKSIFLFTRNTYQDWCQPINEMLRSRPDFLSSFKDSFDDTCMHFEFRTPEKFIERVAWVADQTDNRPPMVRYQEILKAWEEGKENAQTSRVNSVCKKIGAAIKSAMETGQNQKVNNESGGIDISCGRPPKQD